MKLVHVAFILFSARAIAEDVKQEQKPAAPKDQKPHKTAPLKLLSAEEQKKLLSERLKGGMGNNFAQFANMFMVSSALDLGVCVGLSAETKEIAEMELQSPFPAFYKPTLSEFLDALALQTSSAWSYKKEAQVVSTDSDDLKEQGGVVIFSFSETKPPAQRSKPFTIDVAQDWTFKDHGNWVGYIPPSFPVGMDIYEMGSYSANDKSKEAAALTKVRSEIALEWARRVKPDAKAGELKPAKVGGYEALHFDSMIHARNGKDVRWRHWVFTVGNRCYLIVSTIFPDKEATIFPDVEKMLGSFRPRNL